MNAYPGWYADPSGEYTWRWWDGTQWTSATSGAPPTVQGYGGGPGPAAATGDGPGPGDGYGSAPAFGYGDGYGYGAVITSPPPALAPARGRSDAPFPTLPFKALWFAAAGLIGGFIVASIAAIVCVLVFKLDVYSPVSVVVDLVSLWIFLAGAAILASKKFGTGSLAHDYRWGFQPKDALLGVGGSVVGRLAVTVVTGVVLAAAGHKISGNTQILKQQQGHAFNLLVVGAGAVIGAPIVEELFFRGLLLRSLASKVAYPWAVVIQGVLFGLAHAQTGQDGWTIVAVIAGTASFGMVQGYFAQRWRLGALMVSHGLYNLLPVLFVAFS